MTRPEQHLRLPGCAGNLKFEVHLGVRRYKTMTRTTPDDVARRLHFLTLIVGDLSGAYNDLGIRQWFERKRAQLGNRAPAQLLSGAWDPASAGAAKVRELARSLTASPAT